MFEQTAFYTIRYDIDATNGDISNIVVINSLGGSLNYDAATSTFTGSNTDLTAFVSSSMFTNSSHLGIVDDFALVVPEPVSLTLLGLGGLLITRRRG